MKKIGFITQGNSTDINCWSNIPYFLSNNLIRNGYELIRINADYSNNILKLFWKLINFYYYYIRRNRQFRYNRTFLYRKLQWRTLAKKIKKIDDSVDCYVVLCFNLPIYKITNKKIFLYGDWNYDYLIRVILKRTPYKYEKKYIHIEKQVITHSTKTICMFKTVHNFFMNTVKTQNLIFLGNTINISPIESINDQQFKIKFSKNHFLFIGSKKYISAALSLANAIEKINSYSTDTPIYMDIIGIEAKDFHKTSKYIKCYGYLTKSDKKQYNKYKKIILSSKAIVNVTKGWAGLNSIVESMYYFLPTIVFPFDEFLLTFGQNPSFARYCENNEQLNAHINFFKRICFDKYKKMCIDAHNAVSDWKRDIFVAKFINVIEKAN